MKGSGGSAIDIKSRTHSHKKVFLVATTKPNSDYWIRLYEIEYYYTHFSEFLHPHLFDRVLKVRDSSNTTLKIAVPLKKVLM